MQRQRRSLRGRKQPSSRLYPLRTPCMSFRLMFTLADGMFRLGIGASLPKDIADGDSRRSKLSTNDQLRKKLLGKRPLPGVAATSHASGHVASKPTGVVKNHKPAVASTMDEEDIEADGRSSLGKSKRRKKIHVEKTLDLSSAEDAEDLKEGSVGTTPKRPANFLDEVLAAKEKKRRKKSKSKKAKQGSPVEVTMSNEQV